jgi:hypothetical protein
VVQFNVVEYHHILDGAKICSAYYVCLRVLYFFNVYFKLHLHGIHHTDINEEDGEGEKK